MRRGMSSKMHEGNRANGRSSKSVVNETRCQKEKTLADARNAVAIAAAVTVAADS